MAAVTKLEAVNPPNDEVEEDMEDEFPWPEVDEATAAAVSASVWAYKGAAAAVAWLMATLWASVSCFLKWSASARAFLRASSSSWNVWKKSELVREKNGSEIDLLYLLF